MLRIANLTKSFPAEGRRHRGRPGAQDSKVFAVNDVSFEVGEGELFTLLGPSGCGKTTTLRSIAGLERPDAGEISLGERTLFRSRPSETGRSINLPANDRGLGMVFQSYAIWPHMSVFDNVAYPLQVQRTRPKPGKKQIAERVSRILEVMELAPLRDRSATKLSGGQQQRLALARALVTEPSLMLLDEPLSNLDAKLRESLRFELKRLQRDLGLTSFYVTHDQAEALALSSRIAVMRSGSVVQLGTPREIYTAPNSQFVAEFIGTSNFISGVAQGSDGDTLLVDTVEGRLVLHGVGGQPAGSEVIVSVRPEAIEIGTESLSAAALNEWRGEVVTRSFLGDAVDHIVKVGKYEMRVRCNPSVSIPQGTNVYVWLNPEKLSLVPLAQ